MEFSDKLSPEEKAQIEQMMRDHHKACEAEFEASIRQEPENVIEHTQEYFKKNIKYYVGTVHQLALNASSESVQLSACKFAIELATQLAKDDGDPIKDLFKKLDKKPQPANRED